MLILIKFQVICTNIQVVLVQNAVFHTGHTDDNDFVLYIRMIWLENTQTVLCSNYRSRENNYQNPKSFIDDKNI